MLLILQTAYMSWKQQTLEIAVCQGCLVQINVLSVSQHIGKWESILRQNAKHIACLWLVHGVLGVTGHNNVF